MMTRTRSILVACGLLSICCPAWGMASDPLVLHEKAASYALGPYLYVLEDTKARWRIQDVVARPLADGFERNHSEVINFGFNTSAFWLHVDLQSRLKKQSTYLLEIDYPLLDHIEIYVQRPDGTFDVHIAGDLLPHGQKVIHHTNFVFPVQLDPGQRRRIYLKVQTQGSVLIPVTLWTLEGFWDHEHSTRIVYGIYYGLVIVVFFYNLLLFFATRDRSYLYFVLFVLSLSIFSASNDGHAMTYIWPNWPWWGNRVIPFSLCAACFFSLATAWDFLDLKRTLPGWNRVVVLLAILPLIGVPLSFVVPYNPITIYAALLVNPCTFLVWLTAILAWRKKFQPARHFVVAWGLFTLGVIIFAISRMGLVPRSLLIEVAWPTGFAISTIFVSLALADRINLIRQDKEQAQARALQIHQQTAETLQLRVYEKTVALQQRTEELEGAYARLAEYDRLKTDFFTNVSHELRTPLTLILTPLEHLLALRGKELSDSVQERLRSIAGNTQRLLRLVNQLLDFSRLESGSMSVTYQLFDVGALARSVVQAFEPFSRSKGLQLTLHASEQLSRAYVDPMKLEKVMCNLLSNACKFTEPGGKVLVQLTEDEQGLRLVVEDTGIGISEQNLARIFERFHQVDGGASRRYEGTGIGLALSKELVELTGGRLEVQSRLGVGTTFTVWLPLGQDHIQDPTLIQEESEELSVLAPRAEAAATALSVESPKDEPPIEQESPATADTKRSKPPLLVVEDNADMRALVSEICAEEFSVIQAVDGQEGLELIQQRRPWVVISDVMMPRMNGYEMLQQTRANPDTASIPVILLTAKASAQDKLAGLESGANDYLAKPFEARELLARVRILARLQQQELELRALNTRLEREVVSQTAELERTRILERFLPPEVARLIIEGKLSAEALQQRRRITVFILELRDFDEAIAQTEPEDLVAMLFGYLSEMVELAFSHGATVDKLLRDRVIGFFGAPTSESPQQDALRCARMARVMWQRAGEVCSRWQKVTGVKPPSPTMVLASGYAAVGNFGSSKRLDYTAMGGPMEEAQAVLPRLGPNQLFCSQSTWLLIQDQLDGTAYGEIRLSGRQRKIQVYRLAGKAAAEEEGILDAGTVELAHQDKAHLAVDPAKLRAAEAAAPSAPANPDKLAVDTVLCDRYQITRRLGSGGMGTVYTAQDLKLSTTVVLKLLRRDLAFDPHSRSRLHREVKLARLINHHNVACIHDIDEWMGYDFISMEFIEGHTLARRLKSDGAFSIDFGQRVLHQLCAGLGAAHAAGVVHRDLKPANIMLEPGGRVVILDFGIATWAPTSQREGTETGGTPGTPRYMAPERFGNSPADHRIDIYSLGVVAFEMFTGTRFFEGKEQATLGFHHLHTPPTDPQQLRPDLPHRLTAAILRCLEKDPDQRFSSMGELSTYIKGANQESEELTQDTPLGKRAEP